LRARGDREAKTVEDHVSMLAPKLDDLPSDGRALFAQPS